MSKPEAPLETSKTPRRKGRPVRRWVSRLFLALVVVGFVSLAAAWVWIESEAGAEKLRVWVEKAASSQLDRPVRIADLEVDVVPFRLGLAEVAIEGTSPESPPFLRVDSIDLAVRPWALLSRQFWIQSLVLTNPVAHVEILPDGSSNAPRGRRRDEGERFNVQIRDLRVAGGRLDVNHRETAIDARLSNVEASMSAPPQLPGTDPGPTRGRLQIGTGFLAVGGIAEEAIRFEPLNGAFDVTLGEDRMLIDRLMLVVGNSRIQGAGSIEMWRSVSLQVNADLDLVDLDRLHTLPGAGGHDGTVTVVSSIRWSEEEGTVEAAGTLVAQEISLAGIPVDSLDAGFRFAEGRFAVRDLTASVFGGAVNGSAETDFRQDPNAWQVDYSASQINLATLTRLEVLQGLRFAGVASAEGSLQWREPWIQTLSGTGAVNLEIPTSSLAAATAAALPPLPQAQAGEAVPAPSLPLPLTTSASYRLADGVLSLDAARARLPRTTVGFDGMIDLDGPVSLRVALESDDLRMLDQFFTQVRRQRGEQPTPMPLGLDGAGGFDVVISGERDRLELDGRIATADLSVRDNSVGDVSGDVRLSGSLLEIENLVVNRGAGRAEGAASIRIGEAGASIDQDYDFQLSLFEYPLELRLPPRRAPLSIVGAATGSAELAGDYGEAPTGQVLVRAEEVGLNGIGPFHAEGRIRLGESAWFAEQLLLQGEAGSLALTGSWQHREDTVSAELDASNVDAAFLGALAGVDTPLGGRLEFAARVEGSSTLPNATATLRWQDASAYDMPLGSVFTAARLQDGVVNALARGYAEPVVTAAPPAPRAFTPANQAPPLPSVPPSGWAASLSLAISTPRTAATHLSGEVGWARALLAARGFRFPEDMELSGSLELRGSGDIEVPEAWTAEATLGDLRLGIGDDVVTAPEPLRLRLDNNVVSAEVPQLISEDGEMTARGVLDLSSRQWLEGEIDGQVALAVLRLFDPYLEAGGYARVELTASGALGETVIDGRVDLDGATFGAPGWPYTLENLQGSVTFDRQRLELEGVNGSVAERPFTVEGVLPVAALRGDDTGDPVRLQFGVDDLPLAPLLTRSEAISQLVTGGTVSLAAEVRGRGLDWRSYGGGVELDGLVLRLRDLTLRATAPASLSLNNGRLTLSNSLPIRGSGTVVDVSGSFQLSPFTLDLDVQGDVVLDPLNTLIESWGLAGRAEVDLNIVGQPPDLLYTGRVDLSSGLVSLPFLDQPIEAITARLNLQDRRIEIEDWTGLLGGGTLGGTGEIQLRDSRPQSFRFTMLADEVLLRVEDGVRVTMSADIVHEGTLERSLLSGVVSVVQGEYRRQWMPGEQMLGTMRSPAAAADDPFLRSVQLDLQIEAPQNLRVDNNIADLELRADLELLGTLQDPVLLGYALVLEGDVIWRDNVFRILQGAVEFQNPIRTEPSFDVRAETVVRQYSVILNLSGSLERGMQFSYSSSPPLSDLELFRLLALGEAPDGDTSGPTLGNVGLQASSFLTAQYMTEVERGAQRMFGLDRFRIEPTLYGSESDPTARVTLGQQITPDILVTYSTVLGSSQTQIVTIEYRWRRNMRVVGSREEDGSYGIDVRFDHRIR
jgi:autotransporter translocation and assembly factor TamB